MTQINLNSQNNNQNIVRPTLASFFHGVGGMSKGAFKAGFETLYASDMWDAAETAFHKNKCEGLFHNINFFDNNADKILSAIQSQSGRTFEYGDIDAVVSGSPCQGMSSVNGNRSTFNFKNMLMMKQIRVAGMQGLGVRTAWFEQVPGFLDRPMRALRNEVLAVLESQTDYYYELKVLNALDYGAYQSRDRVTIIMVRKDVGTPSFPEPQLIDLNTRCLKAILPHVDAFKYGNEATPKAADSNVISTMTASDDGLLVFTENRWRPVTCDERQILSHLEGYDLSGFSGAEKRTLMGNMVQIPFAAAIMRHIYEEILLKSPVYNNSKCVYQD